MLNIDDQLVKQQFQTLEEAQEFKKFIFKDILAEEDECDEDEKQQQQDPTPKKEETSDEEPQYDFSSPQEKEKEEYDIQARFQIWAKKEGLSEERTKSVQEYLASISNKIGEKETLKEETLKEEDSHQE